MSFDHGFRIRAQIGNKISGNGCGSFCVGIPGVRSVPVPLLPSQHAEVMTERGLDQIFLVNSKAFFLYEKADPHSQDTDRKKTGFAFQWIFV